MGFYYYKIIEPVKIFLWKIIAEKLKIFPRCKNCGGWMSILVKHKQFPDQKKAWNRWRPYLINFYCQGSCYGEKGYRFSNPIKSYEEEQILSEEDNQP